MRFRNALVAAICLVSLAVVGTANAGIVGPAGDYNVFVFGDFSSNGGHTQGNIAAGGNVTFKGSYTVANEIYDGSARLVSGGAFSTTASGSVGPGGNGTVYADSASYPQDSFTFRGGLVSPQNLVDFTYAETYYKELSQSLSSVASNGDVDVLDWGGINLTGSDATLNVFSIDGSDIASTIEIKAPTNSTILINIKGSANFLSGEVKLNGIDPKNVLFNFDEDAKDISITSYGMQGTFLAAWAEVIGNSSFDGQLIAGSFDGTTEFHNVPFTGTVPLPAAIWLFAPAFGFLSVLSRRRRPKHGMILK